MQVVGEEEAAVVAAAAVAVAVASKHQDEKYMVFPFVPEKANWFSNMVSFP